MTWMIVIAHPREHSYPYRRAGRALRRRGHRRPARPTQVRSSSAPGARLSWLGAL